MTTVITQVESRRPLYLQEQWVIIMTSSNMVLRKTASYFHLVIRGHGDSHFQIGQLRLLRRRCITRYICAATDAIDQFENVNHRVQHLEGFFSRIDENHWLLPSPVTVTCVHLFKLQLRYKLRRYLLYTSEKRGSGESPFTDVIWFRSSAFRGRRPHFCQQLTPIYNVFTKNTSSTVIQRMMVYYLSEGCSFAASSFDKFGARSQVACGWSRSHDLLNTTR